MLLVKKPKRGGGRKLGNEEEVTNMEPYICVSFKFQSGHFLMGKKELHFK